MTQPPANITLHIERLVLDGLTLGPGQERLLRAEVEAELTRLLTAGGLAHGLRSGGALPALPIGALQVDVAGSPAAMGRQIARAVYGGIGGGERSGEV